MQSRGGHTGVCGLERFNGNPCTVGNREKGIASLDSGVACGERASDNDWDHE